MKRDALQRLESLPSAPVLAAAFLLRAAYAARAGESFLQIDEHGYDLVAARLAETGRIMTAEGVSVIMPPVPLASFALWYKLLGHALLHARLGQALAGTLIAWMVGRMTQELTGSKAAGRAALLLACVYPFFIYYGGLLMSETPYLLFAVPGVWLLCAPKGRPEGWRPALAGACLALAGLARIEAVPVALPIWAWRGFECLRGRRPWKELALALSAWALVLGLWMARNQKQTGHFTLDSHGGVTMLVGTVVYEITEAGDSGDGFAALKEMPFWKESEHLSPEERDQVYRRVIWDFMKENPGRTVLQWAKKFVAFWRFYPRVDKAYFYGDGVARPDAGLKRPVLVLISLLFEPLLILGGWYGLWTLRRRWDELAPLLLFILGTMGIHMLVVSMMRYRLPVMPFLMTGLCALLVPAKKRA